MDPKDFKEPDGKAGFRFPEQIHIPGRERRASEKIILQKKMIPGVGIHYVGNLQLPVYDAVRLNGNGHKK